ncbi:MAG TPA: 1,4-dihydroxy-2-naphthoate polyprenyltransferase [Planctomycetes bacterium]|nr:1,4-dihydroxy-2-naphthoate polyprenyltransferase [Planctomycetota bacterium]
MTPQAAWLLAIRPKTLPAAVAPVVVGSAFAAADGVFAPLPALAALAGALLLQIGVNLANDYFDCVKGIDGAERLGPVRVAASGLIPLPRLRLGIALDFGLALLVGLYLVRAGGWPVLAIGLAAMLAALGYSGGPAPIASLGLGDVFVFAFFGLAGVCGTYYVQAQALTPAVAIAALPVGALITAILVVNNLRDIASDARAGKRTLAVVLGPAGARIEYALLVLGSYAAPIALLARGEAGPRVLLPLASLPLAARLIRAVYREEGRALNRVLAGSALLALLFSVLLAAGVVR